MGQPERVPSTRAASIELGAMFEAHGWPRLVGRVLGELLLAEPPFLSSAELCELIPTSKGNLSGAIRMLSALGMVERFGIPGSRRDHYRLTRDAFVRSWSRAVDPIDRLTSFADRVLPLLEAGTPAYEQVERMRDLYRFVARRLPDLVEEFERGAR